jgi:hypothetical protein
MGIAHQIDRKQVDLFDRLDHLRDEALRLNHERSVEQARTLEYSAFQVDALSQANDLLLTEIESSSEGLTALGMGISDIRGDLEFVVDRLGALQTELNSVQSETQSIRTALDRIPAGTPAALVGAAVDRIDEAVARFLNYATSNQGFASQRLLWFNEPVSLLYEEGAVRASAVNERIVEVPYAFGAVSRLPTGVKLLDVGATESLVSLSLASLGYDVTALDPRPYPFVHPNLSVVVGLMQEWVPPTQFDCVLCISTIEHIGLGAYGEPVSDARADEAAMSQIWRSTAPGGVLVLTTRFGKPSQDWLHRTYNRDQILALLEGWRIEDEVVVRRAGPLIWTSATSEASRTEESVIMITARKVS